MRKGLVFGRRQVGRGRKRRGKNKAVGEKTSRGIRRETLQKKVFKKMKRSMASRVLKTAVNRIWGKTTLPDDQLDKVDRNKMASE